MHRRDFLSTGGAIGLAAALVPSWLLPRTLRSKTIDLGLFVDDCMVRYDVSQPFMQGEHVYATDCRVAVRVGREIAANLAARSPRTWPGMKPSCRQRIG